MRTLDFPPLFEETAAPWRWPKPPFAWRAAAPDDTPAQPCRIEPLDGDCVAGEMLGFDPSAAGLTLRTTPDGKARRVPFSSFRRLRLTTPLLAAPKLADAPVERVPAAAQEREYRLQPTDASAPLTGRTVGHVETPEGLYLFSPVDEERSVQRIFVPRSAFVACEFGSSAEEIAASRWIVTPQSLLEAIERQQRVPVIPIGQALLDLGLLTPAQLERALAQQPADVPLGEMLVAGGVISRSNLQTALAHKMGYPLVDLSRFPIEPAAARTLTLRMAIGSRAVPLMTDGKHLIVAVDRPARTAKLRVLRAFSEVTIVPVLASKSHILLALTRLAEQDVWAHNVVAIPAYFPTTV